MVTTFSFDHMTGENREYRRFHRGHVKEKHVLTGRKRDMLGNQTFEVQQPLKRTVYTIPFT